MNEAIKNNNRATLINFPQLSFSNTFEIYPTELSSTHHAPGVSEVLFRQYITHLEAPLYRCIAQAEATISRLPRKQL
jgi:hypothetical protein